MPRLTVHARRALEHERRQQILTAAATVFAEKGFDRATISDVARAAGVADGSIYNYFRSKQDLLVHLPRQFIQSPIQAVHAAASVEQAPDPEVLLQMVVQNIVHVATQNRELLRVLFTSIPLMDVEMRSEFMREVPLYAFETLIKLITTEQAAGVFRADLDPAIAARALPGMMLFFLLVQEIIQPPDLPRFEYERVIPEIVQIFLRGVIAAPNPSPKGAVQNVTKRKAGARKTTRPTRHRTIAVE